MSTITVKSDGTGITVSAQGPQGAQGIPGGVGNIVEVSTDYTTQTQDAIVIGTGTLTITLVPLASADREITIKTLTGGLTLTGNGSELIEGSATQILASGQSLTIVPGSTGWSII